VVHGMKHTAPELVTQELLDELHRLQPYDPEHLPREIELNRGVPPASSEIAPVACFDTAFHRTMPRVARMLPIPRRFDARNSALRFPRFVLCLSNGGTRGASVTRRHRRAV